MNHAVLPTSSTSPTQGVLGAALARTPRSDGVEARQRLLEAGLTLFAEKGFTKTSTREIAQAARTNIAAISYYFGDKAGLYQAVFTDPRSNPKLLAEEADDGDIRQVLQGLLRGFLDPMTQGQHTAQCMKLYFREMLEPTGLWQQEIENNIKPAHMTLVKALCRHLGLVQADDDIHRLAFSLAGLGATLHVFGDVLTAIRPQLLASPEAVELYFERLLDDGLAMVEAEARRRAAALQGDAPSSSFPLPAVKS
ncbi:CerR family C-terminal domain-containing protein [Rhodoferax sp.]|uniref:CerR family C-terminal domain-containing protein n=1 Tax=Rhodoferax sp. TaxID=50421 RepID=UPI00261E5E65|nr:CerR family C-terminal domain-containing protein [Rhodoferax sp.]MDD2925221.1 CerR family C-terminal domain-containing protein [Rhodoferax sp.]